jgi:hypothetical protein
MRLIRLTTNYPAYLKDFYARRPGLDKKPYAQQYSELVADGFGWADFWTNALSPLGYEVWEPIANAEALQKVWAEENDVSFDVARWMHEILQAQARSFRPDVVFIDDYAAFDANFVRQLRAAVPSIRLVAGWCAAPYADATVFAHYDVVLTSIPGAADHFRAKGYRAEVVKHAFDPRILDRIELHAPKRFAFTFVGSVRLGAAHLERRQSLLRDLAREARLEIFADVAPPPLPDHQRSSGLIQRFFGRQADPGIRAWREFAGKLGAAKFGLEMFQTLRDSEVTLNAHSDFFGDWASNMRLYEATGVGTCLLTDWKHNLASVFEPDKEVMIYRSLAECIEKVRWLVDHPREREAIASAGQSRTLREHTFQHRAQVLDTLIQRYLRKSSHLLP